MSRTLKEDLDRFLANCLSNGFKVPENRSEAELNIYWNLAAQDNRYKDPFEAVILDVFLRNNGILRTDIIFNTTMAKMEEVRNSWDFRVAGYANTQAYEKAIMTLALKEQRYVIEGYETKTHAGRADITAFNDATYIIGECSQCRIDKVQNAVDGYGHEKKEQQLWHLPKWPYKGEKWTKRNFCNPDTDAQSFRIYIYRKGPHFDELKRLLIKALL